MTTKTRTSKKTGPKAASKTAPETAAKAAPKTAAATKVTSETATPPKAETVAAPKPVALAVVEEATEKAAAVETSAPAAAVEIATPAESSASTIVVRKMAAGDYDDFTAAQKEGVDAFVKAGEVLTKGAEELTRTCFGLCQDVATAQAEAATAMLAVKSLDELVELQNELARKAFDRSVADSTRISEMSLKIANEAFGPIQTQLTVVVEKALKPLAA